MTSLSALVKIILGFMLATSFRLSQSKLDKPPFTPLNSLCDMTLYPKSCYDTPSPIIISKNNPDPYILYNTSVQVSIDEMSRVSNNFSENGALSRLLEGTREEILQSALESCRDFLTLALYNLNLSVATDDSTLTTYENWTNFKTWLSAAEADLQTCMDGFEDARDDIRKIISENLDKSIKLITTSLAILSSIDANMSSSKEPTIVYASSELTSDWKPIWLSSDDRIQLQKSNQTREPDAIVAADGSCDYKTITDSIKDVPEKSNKRFVIYVKEGVYHENVKIGKEKWNILMYGDGMGKTIVSNNLSYGARRTTSLTATFAVYGKGFIAIDMGFQNTAGAVNHQAVALSSSSDQSVFYRCLIDAYQDTLYAHSNRQFYQECKIYGTVDFIFGYSAVVIQNSDILVKRPLPSQKNTITAQGKRNPYSNSGISIQKCNITAAENLDDAKTFLGRPWKDYSTTVVMQSQLGSLIDPQGWLPWNKSAAAPDTISYIEYDNVGPGAMTTERVKWKGLKVKNTQDEARNFTVRSFIDGVQWLPSTGVPFQADL